MKMLDNVIEQVPSGSPDTSYKITAKGAILNTLLGASFLSSVPALTMLFQNVEFNGPDRWMQKFLFDVNLASPAIYAFVGGIAEFNKLRKGRPLKIPFRPQGIQPEDTLYAQAGIQIFTFLALGASLIWYQGQSVASHVLHWEHQAPAADEILRTMDVMALSVWTNCLAAKTKTEEGKKEVARWVDDFSKFFYKPLQNDVAMIGHAVTSVNFCASLIYMLFVGDDLLMKNDHSSAHAVIGHAVKMLFIAAGLYGIARSTPDSLKPKLPAFLIAGAFAIGASQATNMWDVGALSMLGMICLLPAVSQAIDSTGLAIAVAMNKAVQAVRRTFTTAADCLMKRGSSLSANTAPRFSFWIEDDKIRKSIADEIPLPVLAFSCALALTIAPNALISLRMATAGLVPLSILCLRENGVAEACDGISKVVRASFKKSKPPAAPAL